MALKDKLYQLTYISNTGFVYQPEDLSPIERFHYPRQGWGMTTDGEYLIVSDGSAGVAFLDPETFEALDSPRALIDILEPSHVS